MQELKPCPFCGGEAAPTYPGARFFEICCMVCNAETDIYDSFDEAANAWNQRAERTCKVTEYKDCGPHAEDCSISLSCGHETLGYIPSFCPHCGAKVVE